LKTRNLMLHVVLAMLPGVMTMTYFSGLGIVLNIVIVCLAAITLEGLICKIRHQPLDRITDGSTLVTGVILGLCLPPTLPALYLVIGTIFAIIFAKHMYGGLGQNIFNPAMVGFAVLIIAYPLPMSTWYASQPDMLSLMQAKLFDNPVDGITAATPLDQFRFRGNLTTTEFFLAPELNWAPFMFANIAFLLGGLYLFYQRICDWRAPIAMLATIALLAALFYDTGSSASLGSPLFHLFSGATMLAAFFVVTDPVTSPDSVNGQWIFGIGVGLLTFIIRSFGAYPEGIAFAILLMNAVSPLIDYVEYRIRPEWQA